MKLILKNFILGFVLTSFSLSAVGAATSAPASNFCIAHFSEDQRDDVQTKAQEVLNQIAELEQHAGYRRVDVDFASEFQKGIGLSIREYGEVVSSISQTTAEALSSGHVVKARKLYVKASDQLISLMGFVGPEKSIMAQLLKQIPAAEKSRVAKIEKNIAYGTHELDGTVTKLQEENENLVKLGEGLTRMLEKVAFDIEVMKFVIAEHQKQIWNQSGAIANNQLKVQNQKEITKYLDRILQDDLLNLYGVGSHVALRIDQALTQNQVLIDQAQGFLNTKIPAAQGVSDRKLNISKRPRVISFAEKAQKRISEFSAQAKKNIQIFYQEGKLFLAVGLLATAGYYGNDALQDYNAKQDAIVATAQQIEIVRNNAIQSQRLADENVKHVQEFVKLKEKLKTVRAAVTHKSLIEVLDKTYSTQMNKDDAVSLIDSNVFNSQIFSDAELYLYLVESATSPSAVSVVGERNASFVNFVNSKNSLKLPTSEKMSLPMSLLTLVHLVDKLDGRSQLTLEQRAHLEQLLKARLDIELGTVEKYYGSEFSRNIRSAVLSSVVDFYVDPTAKAKQTAEELIKAKAKAEAEAKAQKELDGKTAAERAAYSAELKKQKVKFTNLGLKPANEVLISSIELAVAVNLDPKIYLEQIKAGIHSSQFASEGDLMLVIAKVPGKLALGSTNAEIIKFINENAGTNYTPDTYLSNYYYSSKMQALIEILQRMPISALSVEKQGEVLKALTAAVDEEMPFLTKQNLRAEYASDLKTAIIKKYLKVINGEAK